MTLTGLQPGYYIYMIPCKDDRIGLYLMHINNVRKHLQRDRTNLLVNLSIVSIEWGKTRKLPFNRKKP